MGLHTKSFHSSVENLSTYFHAKFEASTAIAQKLVSFLVQTCTNDAHPTLTTLISINHNNTFF